MIAPCRELREGVDDGRRVTGDLTPGDATAVSGFERLTTTYPRFSRDAEPTQHVPEIGVDEVQPVLEEAHASPRIEEVGGAARVG